MKGNVQRREGEEVTEMGDERRERESDLGGG